MRLFDRADDYFGLPGTPQLPAAKRPPASRPLFEPGGDGVSIASLPLRLPAPSQRFLV